MRLVVHLDPIVRFQAGSKNGQPNALAAAILLDNAGVDGVVARLSDDFSAKTIQNLKLAYNGHLNVEIPVHQDSVRMALDIKPDMVTFLSASGAESNGEGTSNGHSGIREYVSSLHAAEIDVCLFTSADLKSVKEARALDVDAVCLDVSPFTEATSSSDALYHLEEIESASLAADKLGLQVSSYGGINDKNIANLATLGTIDELILGHGFFARSVFIGLENAFNELRDLLRFLMIRNG